MDEAANKVIAERMSNLGEWELYRFADEDTDEVVCKIALRIDQVREEVEYGVWRQEEAEPSATGSIEWESESEWNDKARERVLREIAETYEEGLPEVRNGIDFQIGKIDEGSFEDENEDVEDENEPDDHEDLAEYE